MDVQTEQRAVIKFFVCLKKPIPYILAQLMEAYKNEGAKPSTVKKIAQIILKGHLKTSGSGEKIRWSTTHIVDWDKCKYCAQSSRKTLVFTGALECLLTFWGWCSTKFSLKIWTCNGFCRRGCCACSQKSNWISEWS